MPDITMCFGDGCFYKDRCYRFTATPRKYQQSFFSKSPIQEGECEKFIDNKLKKTKKTVYKKKKSDI